MNLKRPIVAGIAIAALSLSSFASLAQATKPVTPAPAPAAPATGAPPAAATAALPLDQQTDPNRPAIQNWLKVCDPNPAGQKVCVMRQIVNANGQFLGSFLLRDDPGQESRLLAIAAVPLGVLLPFGLTWQIDGNNTKRVPYMLCDRLSCASQLVINEDYLNALKKGSKLTLIAKNQRNKDLVIAINLAGFTDVYDGDASLTFDELRKDTTGGTALEKVLQDRAEQLRQQLDKGVTSPTDGTATVTTTTPTATSP